jgi:hypothetical protein
VAATTRPGEQHVPTAKARHAISKHLPQPGGSILQDRSPYFGPGRIHLKAMDEVFYVDGHPDAKIQRELSQCRPPRYSNRVSRRRQFERQTLMPLSVMGYQFLSERSYCTTVRATNLCRRSCSLLLLHAACAIGC